MLHGGYGEGKASFFSFSVGKMSESSFRESISTNFITNVANNSQVRQNIPFVNLKTQLFRKGQMFIYHCISGV